MPISPADHYVSRASEVSDRDFYDSEDQIIPYSETLTMHAMDVDLRQDKMPVPDAKAGNEVIVHAQIEHTRRNIFKMNVEQRIDAADLNSSNASDDRLSLPSRPNSKNSTRVLPYPEGSNSESDSKNFNRILPRPDGSNSDSKNSTRVLPRPEVINSDSDSKNFNRVLPRPEGSKSESDSKNFTRVLPRSGGSDSESENPVMVDFPLKQLVLERQSIVENQPLVEQQMSGEAGTVDSGTDKYKEVTDPAPVFLSTEDRIDRFDSISSQRTVSDPQQRGSIFNPQAMRISGPNVHTNDLRTDKQHSGPVYESIPEANFVAENLSPILSDRKIASLGSEVPAVAASEGPEHEFIEVVLTKGATGLGFTLAGGKSTTGKLLTVFSCL